MSDTTVAILGVIAGFITAFLAEPVKIYFQNRARFSNLRMGLYKEMCNNYVTCKSFLEGVQKERDALSKEDAEQKEKVTLEGHIWSIKTGLRTECYQQAITTDVYLFYQLPEANLINFIHNAMSAILLSTNSEFTARHSVSLGDLITWCNGYVEFIFNAAYAGDLDQKALKETFGLSRYKELLEKGREVSNQAKKK